MIQPKNKAGWKRREAMLRDKEPRIEFPEVTDLTGYPWFTTVLEVVNLKLYTIHNSYGKSKGHISSDGALYLYDQHNAADIKTGLIFNTINRKGLLQAVRMTYLLTQETLAEREQRLATESEERYARIRMQAKAHIAKLKSRKWL